MSNDLFDNWIYEKNADNTARFILGEKGESPLICIGVNPSTAEPGKLDPTLRQVKNRAARMGYDGWIMLNLYPQRATNPNDLHENRYMPLTDHNEHYIGKAIQNCPTATIWAAWGTLISKREYLAGCLRNLITYGIPHRASWITIGPISQKGHPHHPLYLAKDAEVKEFDITAYLKGLK